jgi:antitoxin CptB
MTKSGLTTPPVPPVGGHDPATRRKKLGFRAWHRGTREADLMMGRFADVFLQDATMDDMDMFDALLAENDPDIYDWVTARLDVPANHPAVSVILKLRDFYKAF